ncbi:hypothetical protein OS493_013985 [Desmophyllum pertusum]|uniref:Uncharacterized protein n=1 Tax=Desmophyllum pertusum TaxID=174260 RepID=A0A9X0CXW4_9CNID|nr:hypothetical protein OS493_013985 [Desmophyllum pertusum]
MMRGPPGPPRQDQAPPNTNENKPTIRPLMSLSPPPLPLGQQGFDFDLDDEPWKGTPDRRGRKRSAEQEGFRDGERPDRGPDRGPPKPMRPEDEWRRGPDQGPPDGWRGPEERQEDGPWHDDERGQFPRGDFGPGSEGDGAMRGRGKPRGGRRGRGVRR